MKNKDTGFIFDSYNVQEYSLLINSSYIQIYTDASKSLDNRSSVFCSRV